MTKSEREKFEARWNALVLKVKNERYAACKLARGIINRLPIEQRGKHYSRLNGFQNVLRADIRRLSR